MGDVPVVGSLLRALSRAATIISRDGAPSASAETVATDENAPERSLSRQLTRREVELDVAATSANADAVAADASAKMASDALKDILAERAEEEMCASDEEEEDAAFRTKRERDREATPTFTWTATMQRKVDEIFADVMGDVEEREVERATSLKATDSDGQGTDIKFRNGAPTALTKSLSRINTINAPTGPNGLLLRNPNAIENDVKSELIEDSYYEAVMSDKLPAYKKPRRHIARLENLESAVLDKEGKQMPVWRSTQVDMDVFGPGIGLWFAQLKAFGRTFFWLTCLASIPLAHYVYTSDRSDVDVEDETKTTLGMTAASTYAKAYNIDIRTIMAFLSCLDVLIVMIFLCVTAILSRRIRTFVVRVDEALLTLSDFSLQVTGLPNDATEEEVREHFEEFGPVADVVIVRAYGKVLRKRIKRSRLFKQAELLKSELSAIKHKLTKRQESYEDSYTYKSKWRKFSRVREKILALKEWIDARIHEPFDIVCAFVTFEQESDKLTCRDEYFAYFNCFRSERTMFRPQPRTDGKKGVTYHYLRVHQAIEASDILWENMSNVSWRSYLTRRVTTTSLVILLLIGNIVLAVLTADWSKSYSRLVVSCNELFVSGGNNLLYCPAIWNINENSQATDLEMISNANFRKHVEVSDCQSYVESTLWSHDMTSYSPYYQAVGAYSGLNSTTAAEVGYTNGVWDGGMDVSTRADECAAKVCYDCMCQLSVVSGQVTAICKEYYYDQLKVLGFEIGRLTVAAVTSLLLLSVAPQLAVFERHKTVSATERATSRTAFFTLITNVVVVPLLVNMRIDGLHSFPILFRGGHEDVTLDWYSLVLRSMMISTFINATYFGPWRILGAWLQQIWRYTSAPWCLTQKKLNQLYTRPKFTLAERYGQAMTVIFASVILFSAAPILIPVVGLYCFLAYWSDKTLILRYCRFPPLYDHALATQFFQYVPLACLAHFAFASWVFSQWDIPSYFLTGLDGWDEQVYSQTNSDFWTIRANMTKYEQLDFHERFYRVNGLIQIIPLIAYFVYLFVKSVLGVLGRTVLHVMGCAQCLESDWSAEVQFNTFSRVRDNALKKDGAVDEVLSGLPSYRVQDNPEYAALFPEAKVLERQSTIPS